MRPAQARRRVAIGGVVQGVGFRPFVYRLATAHRLTGWVGNDGAGVELEAQGAQDDLEAFCAALQGTPPPRARIDRFETRAAPVVDGERGFVIQDSRTGGAIAPVLPADLATCEACLRELDDPTDRRHGYPFLNCTDCGPRYTIVEGLPYDRPHTSMRRFALCAACQREYEDPGDRRYHAQPIACPSCGPRLRFLDGVGASVGEGETALAMALAALAKGQIVACKALGGFQLLVDATDNEAVARLRERKRRPDKPFALLARDLAMASVECVVSEETATLLSSARAPIVLLPRAATATVAGAIAPDNALLGVMLPSTPLHHLIAAAAARPLVCTSGNLADEPIAFLDEEALDRLAGIADGFLLHDRPIVRAVDDSLLRPTVRGPLVLRRARGFAPEGVAVPGAAGLPPVLAVGAQQKSTVTLLVDGQAIVSQHLGDLGTLEGNALHARTIEDLLGFFAVKPAAIACDLHPDYASTQLAEQLAATASVPLVRVQHHHAHALALAAETALAAPFLALAWDGAGHGPDGTSWGGEALLVDGLSWRRGGSVRSFALLGGDAAAREPRRSALGLWCSLVGVDAPLPDEARWWPTAERANLRRLVAGSPRTSSVGRLFDAVAALLGVRWQKGYEGQAALALELAATNASPSAPLPWRFLEEPGSLIADPAPLVIALVERRQAGEPIAALARAFHVALAELALAWAERTGLRTVALTGGCFQNALLVELTSARLTAAGFEVVTHRHVPPNDGGVSLGQALAAALTLQPPPL